MDVVVGFTKEKGPWKAMTFTHACEDFEESDHFMIGGHPEGTAAIGTVVDQDFESLKIKNLYVCDTSIFPRSPGSPPVLTLIAMVKKWARELAIA